jgi:hypothetical protein
VCQPQKDARLLCNTDSLLATQHVMEMFRHSFPDGNPQIRLLRLSKCLIKTLAAP